MTTDSCQNVVHLKDGRNMTSSSHILIVDDEPDVCEVIQDRLQASGYQTHYVLNGSSALEYTSQHKPDLILLDVMMPDMDGYEVSRRLMNSEPLSSVPIIMLTAKQSQSDKIRALTMGIDDYITKPYDADELVARIESVLRRSKQPLIPRQNSRNTVLSAEDQKRLNLLKEMKKSKISRLEPVYDILSQNGYHYPFAGKILEKEHGLEISDLQILAERDCLEKKFFDKVLLCPFCKNYNINLRDTCLSCKSAQLKTVEMLHHYRCAHIGKEEEFKSGLNYSCPKCHKELKHIGVDYDRVGKNHLCLDCRELHIETEMRAECRHCKRVFSEEQAIQQTIHSYAITGTADECLRENKFPEPSEEKEQINELTELYHLHYFKSELSQELKRCQVFSHPLSLIFVQITNFASLVSTEGETAALEKMKDLAKLVKASLKLVDIPAQLNESGILALLIECSVKETKNLISEIQNKIKKLQDGKLEVNIRSVSFPENGSSEESLLKQLVH